MRLARLLALGLACLPLAVATPPLHADDEAAEAPAAAGPVTITRDWKDNIKKKRSAALAKERAAYWAEKVKPSDKDIYWLGWIWDMAKEREKAIECFQAYLKIEGGNDTNREACFTKIRELYTELKKVDEAIVVGKEVLKQYPGSRSAGANWQDLGRLHRRKGDMAAAEAAFRESIPLKRLTSLFDMVDIYLVAGDVAKARAAMNEFRELFQKDAVKANFDLLEAFLGRVGSAAPSLESATPIVAPPQGDELAPAEGSEAPAAPAAPAIEKAYGGKPTLLYHADHRAMLLDVRMRNLKNTRSVLGDSARVLGLASLKKFDVFTQKEDTTLTAEGETDRIGAWLEKNGQGAQVLLLDEATVGAFGLRWPGQMVLVDREGKLRWMRLNDENSDGYDWVCAQEAVKKLGG